MTLDPVALNLEGKMILDPVDMILDPEAMTSEGQLSSALVKTPETKTISEGKMILAVAMTSEVEMNLEGMTLEGMTSEVETIMMISWAIPVVSWTMPVISWTMLVISWTMPVISWTILMTCRRTLKMSGV